MSTGGEYGSGDRINDNNTSQGNDYTQPLQQEPIKGDPLQQSLGSTQTDGSGAEDVKGSVDTSGQGGYGVNEAGDSFSVANQRGESDEGASKGQFK